MYIVWYTYGIYMMIMIILYVCIESELNFYYYYYLLMVIDNW